MRGGRLGGHPLRDAQPAQQGTEGAGLLPVECAELAGEGAGGASDGRCLGGEVARADPQRQQEGLSGDRLPGGYQGHAGASSSRRIPHAARGTTAAASPSARSAVRRLGAPGIPSTGWDMGQIMACGTARPAPHGRHMHRPRAVDRVGAHGPRTSERTIRMSVKEQIRPTVEGPLSGLGLLVEDVAVTPAGRRRLVRIWIDRDLASDGSDVTARPRPEPRRGRRRHARGQRRARCLRRHGGAALHPRGDLAGGGPAPDRTAPLPAQRLQARHPHPLDGEQVTGRIVRAGDADLTIEVPAAKKQPARTHDSGMPTCPVPWSRSSSRASAARRAAGTTRTATRTSATTATRRTEHGHRPGGTESPRAGAGHLARHPHPRHRAGPARRVPPHRGRLPARGSSSTARPGTSSWARERSRRRSPKKGRGTSGDGDGVESGAERAGPSSDPSSTTPPRASAGSPPRPRGRSSCSGSGTSRTRPSSATSRAARATSWRA